MAPVAVFVEPTGGVTTIVESAGVIAPRARSRGGPSGKTQVTSRFEQKSGIVVRSAVSAARATPPDIVEIVANATRSARAFAGELESQVMIRLQCTPLRLVRMLQIAGRSGTARVRYSVVNAELRRQSSGDQAASPIEVLGPEAFSRQIGPFGNKIQSAAPGRASPVACFAVAF
jgi:hypothetical protein